MYIGDYEVTRREIISSLVIIFIMIFVGMFISNFIADKVAEGNEEYYKAVKINDNQEQFEYGMKTSIGNALIYGELNAVDTVSIPELTKDYLYINKCIERYTQHTRTVTYTDSKGKTKTKIEIYYEWDYIGSEELESSNITFLGVKFPTSKVKLYHDYHPSLNSETVSSPYQSWISGSYLYQDGDRWANVGDTRCYFKVIDVENTGSLFAELKNGDMESKSSFENGVTIPQYIEDIENGENIPVIIFWTIWILLTAGVVFGYVAIDNQWLEK